MLLAGLPFSCAAPPPPPRAQDLVQAAERDRAQGRSEQALRLVEEALALEPASLPAVLLKADILAAERRYEVALESLDAALEVHPGAPELLDAKVSMLRPLGRCQEGARILDELIQAWPDSAELHYEKGELLAAGGHDEARAAFQRARELDPLWWPPYVGEAALLLERGGAGRLREAADLLAAAPPVVRAHPEVRFHRALCAEGLGDVATARELYEALITDFPGDRESWINVGLLYQRTADLELARDAFRRALDLTPAHNPTLRDQLTQRLEDISGQ